MKEMDGMTRARAGADAGGTFTDFVGLIGGSNELKVGKTLSTPDDPASAIEEAARRAELPIESIELLIYGTTVATNALVERKGAKVGLLATYGFRDLIAIQRVTRPDHFDLHWIKTPALVPRRLRRGVKERVLFDGAVETPLDEADLRNQIQFLLDENVEAISVAYLFSFMNSAHEERTREIIHEMAPNMQVSLSCEVLPKWGEFQRTSTTVIDAHLKPLLNKYLKALDERCHAHGIGSLQIMQSNGGASAALLAAETPARLVKSGPAGGVIAAAHLGKLTGQEHVLIADMGGTSFEAGFMPNCDPCFTTREELEFGVPISLNMIDVRSIGAGGGSIARIDEAGILKVGPQSAGSNPGPACYGQGGAEATITDANVVLGRMVEAFPLGGHLKLKKELSEQVIDKLAEDLGMSRTRVAQGIVEIAVNNMAQAMRLVTIDRGHDPRTATLVPYGGAGPLHACQLAEALQISKVLVPRYPGALSALGALISETRFDYRQTLRMLSSTLDVQRADKVFSDLERKAAEDFEKEGFATAPLLERTIELRYFGQNFELEVPVPPGTVDEKAFEQIVADFHAEHDRLYGYTLPAQAIEFLNLNLAARATHSVIDLPKLAPAQGEAQPIGTADVVLPGGDEPEQIPLYDRETFGAGTVLKGPAIIGQMDTTTLLARNATATVDEWGNMLIELEGATK
ncbi:MAG: hydantoinase/oxoprolinase family protein [Roseovarius sp.]